MRAHADELLRTVDPLPYPRRMREVAAAARDAAARGDLAQLLEGLDGHGGYGRRLAALAASVACDDAYLGARLADPDPVVRGYAAKAVRQGRLADEVVTAAYEDAPAVVRQQLTRAVVRGRRTAVAEALIGPVGEQWGDEEAARLLPACSAETVARLLPGLWPAVATRPSLAIRHPGLVLDEAERQLAALAPGAREEWWNWYAPGVAALAEREPQRVLGLVERLCHGALPIPVYRRLNRFVAAEPRRTLRLLLAPQHRPRLGGRGGYRGFGGYGRSGGFSVLGGLSRSVLRRLIAADPPELADLARVWQSDTEALARLLRLVAPARRGALFDAAMAGRDLGHAEFDTELLDALPRSRREAEARRMAEQARARDAHWETVLEAVACLPVAEAREELTAAVRRPDAGERGQAYALLIRNAARSGDPAAVTDLVALLERLRNDQDPVRSVALAELARTHPALFTGDAAEHLDRIAADAVQARDSSWSTRDALSRLAVALLREHAAGGDRRLVSWALRTITRLTGHTGGADLGRLDTTLRRGQEHEVFEALEPWLEAGADKVDHGLTFALARALGRRASGMAKLQEYLWQAVQFGNDATVRTAVGLWLEPPATRDERVARIVALEPSAAVLDPVHRVLASRRTDLLDGVLGDTPPYGRFLTPGSAWAPPVVTPGRWVPRQQRAAARLLARAAGDASLRTYQRTAAIAGAARIPEAGADVVRRYTGSENVPLAEAALGALVWTDRPGETLPLLLEHVGDDRARIAVYAATRATRHLAPSRLEDALRPLLVPADRAAVKVTSRKEAVRLAATRLPAERAAGLLVRAYELPGQHRDVQAACVAFATGLLGRPEVWELLESAAAGSGRTRLALLEPHPRALQEEHRARYARLVEVVCDTEDTDVVRRAYDVLGWWAPWELAVVGVLRAAVTDTGSRATWYRAAKALVTLALAAPAEPPARSPVVEVVAALLGQAGAGQPDAEADRDLPARRRIEGVSDELRSRSEAQQRLLRPVLRGVAGVLSGDEDFVPHAAELLLHAVDLDAGPEGLAAELGELAGLHEGRPVLAQRTAEQLASRLGAQRRPLEGEALRHVAGTLAAGGGHAAGLLAVAVTETCGEHTDWSGPWREQLRLLRRHPAREVRDAALGVTTAEEYV